MLAAVGRTLAASPRRVEALAVTAWIDRLLLPGTLHAERWGRRVSWRFGQWLHGAATGVHEAALELAAHLSLGRPGPEAVELARGSSPRVAPPYPSFFEIRPGNRSGTGDLLRGERTLSTGQVIRLTDLSWRRDPFGSISSLEHLLFHSLDWAEELLDAWRSEGNPRLLDAAFSLTDRWIRECLFTERYPEIWSDHATAIRSVVLCRLWCLARDQRSALRRPLHRDLLTAILRHGRRLAHPAFYRPDHNHGVTQAYALLAIGLSVPSVAESPAWIRLGRARLLSQLADNFSEEGLHLEHSPYYQFYAYRQLADGYVFGTDRGVLFPDAYAEGLSRCYRAGAHLIKPDGRLAALGDTSSVSPILADTTGAHAGSAELCHESGFTWNPATGPPGTAGISFLSLGGGLAVLQSEIDADERPADRRYVALRLGTFPTSHIHRDVFGFEFYAYGEDLLVDSGGPYAYEDPVRAYFVSTRAHNTVVVDDRDQEIGNSRLLQRESRSGRDVLVAEHSNYPGVTHRRSLVFSRGRYLLLFDILRSNREHSYRQLFHLSPTLTPILKGLAADTEHTSGGATLRLVPLSGVGVSARTRRGESDPLQGWVVAGERRRLPSSVVEYERAGREAAFAVLLLPEPRGARGAVEAVLEGDLLSGGCRVRVSLDGIADQFEFRDDGLLR